MTVLAVGLRFPVSVTVSVKVCVPTCTVTCTTAVVPTTLPSSSLQTKLSTSPSGSLDLDPSNCTDVPPDPVALTVWFAPASATGGWFTASTVMTVLAVELRPPGSLTVSVNVCTPTCTVTCTTAVVPTTLPASSFQTKLSTSLSASLDLDPSNCTDVPLDPVALTVWFAPALATGAWFTATIVTTVLAGGLRPPGLVTVSVSVSTPTGSVN